MDKIAVDFTGVRVTALVELYLRWLDSKEQHPILGDTRADEAVQRLDFDFSQLKPMNIGRFAVGVRSRIMDEWAARYLADNPDALVLDLGCGFDSRVFRVEPSAGHHWYDVDFPDVIEIANQLYPERAEHSTIGASVVDPDWLMQIPGDKPVVVVADGLFGFLTEDEVRRVFKQIVDHFPTGEFLFNTYPTKTKKQLEKRPGPIFGKFGVSINWALDDERAVEKFDDRLHFVDEWSQLDRSLLTNAPLYYRALCAMIRAVPAWRQGTGVLRYRF
ncbi:class I SAM-dependent methyltransferase [Actinoallomurus vinaceus]|uniref:Class I SAM-dependent methyltransferase n=1 Tax=Actinoallomurus vinaceus TaxID=1080074 RepID=A0ABP8U3S9_9ACTN